MTEPLTPEPPNSVPRAVPIRLSPTRTGYNADEAGGVAWEDFDRSAPALAEELKSRLEQHERHILATFMLVGGPRVSGVEVEWDGPELLLTARAQSPQAADLRADPRFEIHVNPGPEQRVLPDFRIRGSAHEVTGRRDPEPEEVPGSRPRMGPALQSFRLLMTLITRTVPQEELTEVTVWRPGREVEVQLRN